MTSYHTTAEIADAYSVDPTDLAATVLEMAKPRPPRVPIRFSARAEADDVDTLVRLLRQQAARCIPTATLSGSVYIEEHKRRGEVDDAPRYWGRAVFEAGR